MPELVGPAPTAWDFDRFCCEACGLLWLVIAQGPTDGIYCPRCTWVWRPTVRVSWWPQGDPQETRAV